MMQKNGNSNSKAAQSMQITARERIFHGALLLLLCPAIGRAQEEHHHHEAPARIGKVNFVVSCSPQAGRQFNQAVAWLHSFEYGESERVFEETAKTDPQCAMASM